MEQVLFVLFSMVEALAIITLILVIYRFRLIDVLWPASFVALVMGVQSLIFRSQYDFANIVPLINILLISLLLTSMLRVPIHWSIFVTICGSIASIILQALVINLSFGWLSPSELQEVQYKGYVFVSIVSTITVLLARWLYSRGIGFSFDFDLKRLKWEKGILVAISFTTLILLGIVLYNRNALVDMAVLSIAILVFLYISIKREQVR